MTAVESQDPGWAFALFAAAGQKLGPVELQAMDALAATVSGNSARLRAAVGPDTPLTAVYSAGEYPAISPKEELL